MSRFGIKYLLGIYIVLFHFISIRATSNQVIKAKSEVQVIGKQIRFYEDKNWSIGIDEAVLLNESGKFENHDKDFFNRPNSTSNYWFTFSVQTDLEDIWINLNNNNLDSVHFYLLDESGQLIRETLTGSILDKQTREFYADTYWFRITKSKDISVKQVYLKVFSSMAMELPIELGSFENLLKNKNVNDFYAQFFIGALVVMLLYNLVLFFIIRERIYIYYIFYVLGTIFANTLINNYPIIENLVGQKFAHLNVTSWIWVSFVSVILFTISYLELKIKRRYIYYILNAYIVILLGFGIIEILFPQMEISNTYQAFVPIVFATCLFTSYSMWFKKDEKARLYSIGWTMLMTSSVIYLLVTNGFLPYNSFTRNVTYIGIVLEVVIFSIALAQRITALKIEQEKLNSELIKTNDELRLSNDSLDSFNYHVSHDLKTVLNNTTVLSRMITKYMDKGDNEKVKEIIGKLEVVSKNGVETVQSFLSLGKVNSLVSGESNEFLDIKNNLNDLLINHNLKEKIDLKVFNPNSVKLNMHPKAFESIFLNLITNSIKYSKNFPQIIVNVTKKDNNVRIKFSDNGIGMDMNKNGSKVFEPFVRLDNELNTEGTGVGLFLVKKIITSLKGTIEVESELGKGTIFTINLPQQVHY